MASRIEMPFVQQTSDPLDIIDAIWKYRQRVGGIAPDCDLKALDRDTGDIIVYLALECRYTNIRVVPDEAGDPCIICTHDLFTTRALLIGVDRDCWEHRYCYQRRSLADMACLSMRRADEAPMRGYVSSRHLRPPKHQPVYTPVDHGKPDYWE